jgi:hypothetical protein
MILKPEEFISEYRRTGGDIAYITDIAHKVLDSFSDEERYNTLVSDMEKDIIPFFEINLQERTLCVAIKPVTAQFNLPRYIYVCNMFDVITQIAH